MLSYYTYTQFNVVDDDEITINRDSTCVPLSEKFPYTVNLSRHGIIYDKHKSFKINRHDAMCNENLLILDTNNEGTVVVHAFPGDTPSSSSYKYPGFHSNELNAYNAVKRGIKRLKDEGIDPQDAKAFVFTGNEKDKTKITDDLNKQGIEILHADVRDFPHDYYYERIVEYDATKKILLSFYKHSPDIYSGEYTLVDSLYLPFSKYFSNCVIDSLD